MVNEYVEVDPKLFRTGEIHDLRGDSALARRSLNWNPEVDFKGLVRMMVESDALGTTGTLADRGSNWPAAEYEQDSNPGDALLQHLVSGVARRSTS